jgi:ribonuclease HI
MPPRLKIYFDGGCRPTPGVMELAVVVRGQAFVLRDQGIGTGTDAEWLALIEACRIARTLQNQSFVILGDCVPVIDQANGRAKARGSSRDLLEAFRALVDGDPPRIRYVKRSRNLAGIALQKLHPR